MLYDYKKPFVVTDSSNLMKLNIRSTLKQEQPHCNKYINISFSKDALHQMTKSESKDMHNITKNIFQ